MPKRKSVVRHKCDEVQGEGSYVIVTGVKIKEIRELRKSRSDAQEPGVEVPDEFEGGIALLVAHIVEWNWVDDVGDPLLCPKDDPKVVDDLTNEETEFLADLLIGTPKN